MGLKDEIVNVKRHYEAVRRAHQAGDIAAVDEGLQIAEDFATVLLTAMRKPGVLAVDLLDGDIDALKDVEARADEYARRWLPQVEA